MNITDFAGKNEHVCILGFGREGKAMLRMLETHAPDLAISLADRNPEIEHPDFPSITGPEYLMQIDRQNFWQIIKSPGIPPHSLFEKWKREGRLTSGTQIFLDTVEDSGATVIGVTGSKGKSTVSTLIWELLKADGRDVRLVGNIGIPAIGCIDDARPGTVFVMEMSSYQLMDLTRSPHIAVITSFFPEHLDYHGSLEAYKNAKAHITRFQTEEDLVFYDTESSSARDIADESKGRKIPFRASDSPVRTEETKLFGNHNLRNIAAAFHVASHLGVPRERCIQVLRSFQGLPHRLQSLGVHRDIEWIDDAISTTPESTIAALDALGSRVATIILGGQDRGSDFTELGKRITASGIRTVILFPGSGQRIHEAVVRAMVSPEAAPTHLPPPPRPSERLGRAGTEEGLGVGAVLGTETKKAHSKINFFDAPDMQTAVSIAKERTPTGKICLLSTASPSYGMFRNFEEKGDLFQRYIQKWSEGAGLAGPVPEDSTEGKESSLREKP